MEQKLDLPSLTALLEALPEGTFVSHETMDGHHQVLCVDVDRAATTFCTICPPGPIARDITLDRSRAVAAALTAIRPLREITDILLGLMRSAAFAEALESVPTLADWTLHLRAVVRENVPPWDNAGLSSSEIRAAKATDQAPGSIHGRAAGRAS